MKAVFRFLSCCGVIFSLQIGPVWADLPDPIAFGVVVDRGDTRTVKNWLDEGLPVDFMADRIGTGLMIAAWNGNIPMMELFVSRGANPRRANIHGEQPVQLAAWNGHVEAVRWLLQHGASLNRDGRNWNALHYAVFNGHDKLAKELIERGADVNARSPNGSTPLMMAAREGRDDIARQLVAAGADTRLKSDWGDSALTFAIRYDHYQIGKMISTPEEFELAVKAPKESFGEPARSVAAPSNIDELLRQIREANAEGKETTELRKKLHSAIAEFRGPPKPLGLVGPKVIRPAPPPKGLVITAKRQQPAGGERVEVVGGQEPKLPPGAIRVTPSQASAEAQATPSRIADLVRQIRLAEAQGLPTESLRRQLDDAMNRLK